MCRPEPTRVRFLPAVCGMGARSRTLPGGPGLETGDEQCFASFSAAGTRFAKHKAPRHQTEGKAMTALMTPPAGAVVLHARTVADLMTPNPLSLREDVTLKEAIAFLVDRNISGAPVIDEAGRPVGVLTQSDVLIHDREEVEHVAPPEAEHGRPLPRSWWEQFQVE